MYLNWRSVRRKRHSVFRYLHHTTMSSPLVFIVLSVLAVSILASDLDDGPIVSNGISGYCWKARLYPFWYPNVDVKCCDDRGICEKYIEANETKYGLTNPDPKWPRRLCSCDEQLYECVKTNMTPSFWNTMMTGYSFNQEICFHEIPDHLSKLANVKKYEFIPFTKAKIISSPPDWSGRSPAISVRG